MKIGLVRRGYSATGGAEAYLLRFAAAAREAGHQCVLYATPDWPDSAWPGRIERVTGAPQARRPLRAGSTKWAPNTRTTHSSAWNASGPATFHRAGRWRARKAWLARRARFEPAWRSRLRGWSGQTSAKSSHWETALFRDGGTHRVIANSRLVADEIVGRFGFPRDYIDIVYNGVPAPGNQPEARREVRAELGLGESDYVAVFAGSGWERKGLRFAIEAVRQTPGVTLLVAGRGKSGGLPACDRVRFLGPRGDVPRLLAAADVFLLPTLYDPFSNASLEALAAGLPVITTAANGFAEIIQPGVEGEIIPEPDDIPALSAALARWRDPERCACVRPQLLALGAQYSIEENVRQTLAVILGQCSGASGLTRVRTHTL